MFTVREIANMLYIHAVEQASYWVRRNSDYSEGLIVGHQRGVMHLQLLCENEEDKKFICELADEMCIMAHGEKNE